MTVWEKGGRGCCVRGVEKGFRENEIGPLGPRQNRGNRNGDIGLISWKDAQATEYGKGDLRSGSQEELMRKGVEDGDRIKRIRASGNKSIVKGMTKDVWKR